MAVDDALGIAAFLLIGLISVAVVIALFLPREKRTRVLDVLWRKLM
jgi:hypothetical protein